MGSIELFPQSGSERRQHPRATIKTAVHLGSESNFYSGFTNDLSEGGLFVATHLVLPIGTRLDLEFSLPDDDTPIRAQGEVRWTREYNPSSDGAPGLGLRFLKLELADRDRIDAFVKLRETLFYD
jgi:uncharacterized protein (TIGR02266 family)